MAPPAAHASADASPAALPAFTRSQKVFTMLGAVLGLLLAALDQTIVATAGPAIQADLHIPASLYPWLTTSYFVASTLMVPVWGKLSDLLGRRAVLAAGILVFLTGSFLCGAARSTVALILFRAVQGLGSAALFTAALAVVADLFEPRERGKYQGLFGAMFGLSSVVGPLAGGFITDHLGWHWVFFINLPVGAVALALVLSRMPKLKPHREARGGLDLTGALTLSVAVVPLLLALSLGKGDGGDWAWGSWRILGLFALAAVGLAAFLRVESRAHDPLLDLKLFRLRAFSAGNAAVFIVGAAFLSGVVFLPLFMVNVMGLSATRSGLTIVPLTLGVVAGNVLSGQLVSRMGRYKALMLGSMALLIAGFAIMGFTLTPDSTQAEVTVKMVLVGLGLGPSIPIYTMVIQNAVPPSQIGVATAAATFFRQLGMTIGVALLGTVFASTLTSELRTGMAQATGALPASVQAELRRALPGVSGEGGPSGQVFQPDEVKSRLRAEFEAERRRETAPEAQAKVDAAERQALAAVDAADRALKTAFTRGVAAVYHVAVFIAVAALLVTLLLPEQHLRRKHRAVSTGEP
ncbi:DHA2 family efflux MFS transporter permease subunit [Comamonas sp. JC664]|uniref:DHA2 family efflux MFS transporter permease subunit n=1 Tax=Comamonas sp. JC664 TaxID=2801917 RepID=UPI00174BFE5D|nr:DHA2 family efflux MFS transporter permease subunit [Comamonas sp. JC664]MBL0698231.1 DHA2 family efflux MFS transporter permease subunit [Comamonas sp. JC664]GHG89103.1 MFS transporter [Comamonas sp. KCTC 72670]